MLSSRSQLVYINSTLRSNDRASLISKKRRNQLDAWGSTGNCLHFFYKTIFWKV